MKDQYIIVDLRTMDFMKSKGGHVSYYDTVDEAAETCGMYEFPDVWICKLVYNHIEDER